MPYKTALNAPYNLLTSNGRAQAYAYSAQGASLVKALESSELTVLEEVSAELNSLIDKAMQHVATDARADADLEQELEIFQNSLGTRDKPIFELLLQTYKDERKFRNENLDRVLNLIREIQKMFNIED